MPYKSTELKKSCLLLFIQKLKYTIYLALVLRVSFGIILPFKQYQDYNTQFKINQEIGGLALNIELMKVNPILLTGGAWPS